MIAGPGSLQIGQPIRPTLRLRRARHHARREQGHAAADVVAHEVRVHEVAEERGADRMPPPRVQVRLADGNPHSGQRRRQLKLPDGFTVDPQTINGDHMGAHDQKIPFFELPTERRQAAFEAR